MSVAVRNPHVPKLAFSLSEAMQATGAGRGTLLGAIHRGELEARAVGPQGPGRKLLIPAEALQRWVAGDTTPTADPEAPGDDPESLNVAQPVPEAVASAVPPGSGQ